MTVRPQGGRQIVGERRNQLGGDRGSVDERRRLFEILCVGRVVKGY